MARHPLDDVVWHALVGPHAPWADVVGTARCYHPDVSVFAALGDLDDAGAWADLATLADRHGPVTLHRVGPVTPPPGWVVVRAGRGHQLVGDDLGPTPVGVAVVALGADDAPRMAELVALAQPGPWRPRTVELGGYVGVVEDGRLLAMAGRRMQAAGHVEVSAVCTHPDAWGRGYGAAVTHAVASAAQAEGLVPFLHVAEPNHRARALYERLGFRRRTTVDFTTLDRADRAAVHR